MREIKFRAWDIEQPYMISYEELINEWENDSFYDSVFRGDHWIPMLFTGLKDKNGVEIYEGDILTGGLLVKWFNSESSFKAGKYWATKGYLSTLEVIGNKFESPELLTNK